MSTYPLSPQIETPLTLTIIESPQGDNRGDPSGIEMETERLINGHPYRSILEE
jgi:hypothetical protein